MEESCERTSLGRELMVLTVISAQPIADAEELDPPPLTTSDAVNKDNPEWGLHRK